VDQEIGGVRVHVAGLDDIIASKEHADRGKDREALPELRRLRDAR
jgi:predicted nucleotidyltransferase